MKFFRYKEKGNIEVQFFNIQAKLKANGQKNYTPPEGLLVHDIETAWLKLEKSEHEREVAMRDEMIRFVIGLIHITRPPLPSPFSLFIAVNNIKGLWYHLPGCYIL